MSSPMPERPKNRAPRWDNMYAPETRQYLAQSVLNRLMVEFAREGGWGSCYVTRAEFGLLKERYGALPGIQSTVAALKVSDQIDYQDVVSLSRQPVEEMVFKELGQFQPLIANQVVQEQPTKGQNARIFDDSAIGEGRRRGIGLHGVDWVLTIERAQKRREDLMGLTFAEIIPKLIWRDLVHHSAGNSLSGGDLQEQKAEVSAPAVVPEPLQRLPIVVPISHTKNWWAETITEVLTYWTKEYLYHIYGEEPVVSEAINMEFDFDANAYRHAMGAIGESNDAYVIGIFPSGLMRWLGDIESSDRFRGVIHASQRTLSVNAWADSSARIHDPFVPFQMDILGPEKTKVGEGSIMWSTLTEGTSFLDALKRFFPSPPGK